MARSAIYSLISLGVRNIFISNRTLSKAQALAKHYNDLIAAGDLLDLGPERLSQTRVGAIESFASAWPSGIRQPTVIISCIPRQAAGESPTNFSLPEAWLKSPTGGVVVEVSHHLSAEHVRNANDVLGCVRPTGIHNRLSDEGASAEGMDLS